MPKSGVRRSSLTTRIRSTAGNNACDACTCVLQLSKVVLTRGWECFQTSRELSSIEAARSTGWPSMRRWAAYLLHGDKPGVVPGERRPVACRAVSERRQRLRRSHLPRHVMMPCACMLLRSTRTLYRRARPQQRRRWLCGQSPRMPPPHPLPLLGSHVQRNNSQ